ncbi:FAD-dependent oxidoreductase (plasmid) [Roseomonas gilardii]|uniref:FAD-dependent oxidoreductase n=1 Tax=Roseomonas gilardii TaxID=257708 RepID=A0A1L7AN65_9PROT|nr:FAD-dependent oxidoreductase [Roseomonas gilardii]
MRYVSVVGGGIAGLLTAWALSRRGVRVTVFEQGPLPNPHCSSFDEHRIIRHAYGAMPAYARLMPGAFSLWDRLWGDIFPAGQQRGYLETGLTYVLRGDNGWYDITAQSLDELGVAYGDVPLDAVPGRYPMLNCDGVTRVVETGGAGVLFPSIIMTALVAALPGMGVQFVPSCKISAVNADAGEVVANGERHRADAVVVAAGAWVDRLVPALKGIAVPSRQAVVYLAPPSDLASAWATAPAIITRDFSGDIGSTYTLPPRQGMRLKVGDHLFSRRGDPDDDRVARSEDLEVLSAALPLVYRDFERYTVLERRACFYTVTEDERFIVRPTGDRTWVVSACSGHGFKLAPAMAEAVAQALTGERDAAGISAWAAPA